jgi:arabinofuranan 3-O-arabinosyltransferase
MVGSPPQEQVESASEPPSRARVIRRLHLLAVSVALTVLTFVQAPGLIAPDTKADLSIDPINFLLRAGRLWEPLGDSGQLQNQAYGYFLPMGPIYALGHLVGLPAWVVQRIWWAIVLLVAFHGMYRLCGRFGVGTHPTRMIAALTFALSPRMITELGPVSIEAWPTALAPWVLLPLIKVRRGFEAGAAARSGLAIAFCGGVNAIAVGAVLPLPIWWLITRERGPLKRRLSGWWALAAAAGMFWWLAPLILLGRFSPPFLDWIESASVSTSKATLPGAFRGTTQWVAWFKLPQPIWLAGWSVLSSPIGILLGWLLIGLAVTGLLRKDTPHRRFLIGASVAGLVLLTTGHTGALTAPWAHAVQLWMDGVGAPLRNTHKFDVILRVPLTLGLALALAKVRLPAVSLPGLRFPAGSTGLRFVAACALLGTIAPALVGQLPARGSFKQVPSAWTQVATWLQQHDDGARTLIVPGSPFAASIWGDPHDEPFQALARTKWATRSGVPLSSAGNIRMLNTVEQQLETGRGSPGLAEFLARAGISRVLLRSDLERSFQAGSAPLPVIVRSSLADSPGLTPVARFGPELHGVSDLFQIADDGLDVAQPQIEIWQIDAPARAADVVPVPDVLRVAGGPESLLTLAEAGQLGSRPTILDGDPQSSALAGTGAGAETVTDSPQRREANFAQVRDNYSQPLTASEPYQQQRSAHDWLPFAASEVTARYQGISTVTASSQSGSSVGAWHAVDGDPTTAWTSSIYSVGQWLDVTFPAPVSLPASIGLTFGAGGARLSQLRATTDAGAETTEIDPSRSGAQPISIPGGTTRHLRLTVTGVQAGEQFAPVSISDLDLPGIDVHRQLVLPAVDSRAAPETIALQSARDGVDGCVFSDQRAICSPRLNRQSEDTDLDRAVTLPAAADYDVEATARVRASTQADALLQPPDTMQAVTSSRRADDPAQRPGAAIDRDPGTAWLASSTDARPTITLSWPRKRLISRLRWQVDPALAASRPVTLQVVGGGRTQNVALDKEGWASFDPVRTDRVTVAVTGIQPYSTLDRVSNFTTVLPIGLSEMVIPGADEYRAPFNPAHPVRTSCGTGPELVIGDATHRTRVSGTADDVLHRRPMSVVPCGASPTQHLPSGPVRLALLATPLLEPEQLVLHRTDARTPVPPATTAPVSVVQESTEHRVITVNGSDVRQLLIVHENANPGWRATLAGQTLTPVRIDGWQQAWIVPAGAGGAVDLRFTPGNAYRVALSVGLLLIALLALLGSADLRRRRRERGAAASGQAAALATAVTLGTDLQPTAPAVAEPPVRLPEGRSGRLDVVLGVAGMLLLGGFFGLAALIGVLVAVRRRVRMRWLVGGATALAGIGAAASTNADSAGFFADVSIAAALVLVACLVVGLDAAGAGLLARLSGFLPAPRGKR